MQRLCARVAKSKDFAPWRQSLCIVIFRRPKGRFFGLFAESAAHGLAMVNQKRVDPSRLPHFTLPARRAKSAEKFRVSPLAASRRGPFETPPQNRVPAPPGPAGGRSRPRGNDAEPRAPGYPRGNVSFDIFVKTGPKPGPVRAQKGVLDSRFWSKVATTWATLVAGAASYETFEFHSVP